MQMHMCCIFCVLIVRKAMKCNILGCSHATAIFHFRLNSHFHDYSSGFKVSIKFVVTRSYNWYHIVRLPCASNDIYYMLMSYIPHIYYCQNE